MSKWVIIEWKTGNHESVLKVSDATAQEMQSDFVTSGNLDNLRKTYVIESFASMLPSADFPGSMSCSLGNVVHYLFYNQTPFPPPDGP